MAMRESEERQTDGVAGEDAGCNRPADDGETGAGATSARATGRDGTDDSGAEGGSTGDAGREAAKDRYSLSPLVEIMRRLRGEGGCPWDRKQTHESLRTYVVEEAYEVVQAIDDRDDEEMREELGDLLLQVAFHAQIASESGRFDVGDVIAGVVEKLIRRHPHVFGNVEARDSKTVLRNWERIKQRERQDGSGEAGSILDNIAGAMPALMRALKVQSKASRVGFDWPSVGGALAKVREEIDELEQARCAEDKARVAEEIGDVLFALVNVARFLKVDPEIALGQTVDKFISRFKHIEMRAYEANRRVEDMTLDEMDSLWEEAKAERRSGANRGEGNG